MKLSVSKLLDTSKLLTSQAGQQLQELINYTSQTFSQVISALRNGLSYQDNFDCLIQRVSLTHNTSQVINRGPLTKSVIGVVPMQTISTTTCVTALVWYMDSGNNLVVVPQLLGAPSSPVTVVLRIEH